ncbi:hypothetical protein Ae201684P_015050 [Aphanomyces euteiches]|nr:hypothetical protein Ae201684P_015050 [Aphanomyces euteiches]
MLTSSHEFVIVGDYSTSFRGSWWPLIGPSVVSEARHRHSHSKAKRRSKNRGALSRPSSSSFQGVPRGGDGQAEGSKAGPTGSTCDKTQPAAIVCHATMSSKEVPLTSGASHTVEICT